MDLDIEGHEYLCFVPPPWESTRQAPIDWLRDNIARFQFSEQHIKKHAVPYELGDGPNKGGVYFLLEDREIVYVGKAKSVHERLIQHSKDRAFTQYWAFGGMPELFVEDIETFYIYYLEPMLNEKYPPIYESFIKMDIERARSNDLFSGERKL